LSSEDIEEDSIAAEEHEIFEQVVERYGLAKEDTIKASEDLAIKELDISLFEAIKALETLKLSEMKQDDRSEALIRALDQADQRYMTKKQEGKKQ